MLPHVRESSHTLPLARTQPLRDRFTHALFNGTGMFDTVGTPAVALFFTVCLIAMV